MIDYYSESNSSDRKKFDCVKIGIASPEKIREWSFGEVKKPETINYRTFKPERDGLFCAKIFGPVKDYECLCGKYKRMKHRGTVCDKCGVEVTLAGVRRKRMAHIELAAPVAHIWFLKSNPSKISTLLDINLKEVERVLYFEAFIITDAGLTNLKIGQVLTQDELNKLHTQYDKDSFRAMIGAEAIVEMLSRLDLEKIRSEQLAILKNGNLSDTKHKKLLKRLKLVEDFYYSSNKPEWMILTVLPILPPDLRPLVQLDGGRFATSDLNELYRRIINRNNRLKRLLELGAPDIIIRNEKRMLQEAVDALFDNAKKGKIVKNANKRPFKSLSDMLKGKQGRFRQNLLGKRVDYSGRSVIVSGPDLKLHQCGLPKQMAIELFKPFIYGKLISKGYVATVKSAKRMVESEAPEVWDMLEEVVTGHPILLNRAPTLHRLSIQAFEPVLVEGKAIRLHPLVCTAFNADFDGDQMAVHVPLSPEARVEAIMLMMSTNNIMSPANGKPTLIPDKDIVLGLYYLTMDLDNQPGEGKIFGSMDEVNHAINMDIVSIHSRIKYRATINGKYELLDTTPGRLILWQVLPPNVDFAYINKTLSKKEISKLMSIVYTVSGQVNTVIFADDLKNIGFKYATISGISFGMDDMIVPSEKSKYIDEASKRVSEFEKQYTNGLITSGELYNKTIDTWTETTEIVAEKAINILKESKVMQRVDKDTPTGPNSLSIMMESGARGSATQTRQLSGMRGLMAKPSGEIIPVPILANFKEGLDVTEYFNSTHGARKGLSDTALKTATGGYTTRRLVVTAQNCIVTASDCCTDEYVTITSVTEGGNVIVSMRERIVGRTSAADIYNLITNELIVAKNEVISEDKLDAIDKSGVDSVDVRSPLTCVAPTGICAMCYGNDLSTGKIVAIGEAVGIIAAQSIGEPGTQLTMRTFHIGGTAVRAKESSYIEAFFDANIRLVNENIVKNSDNISIIMSRSCEVVLLDSKNIEKARHRLPYGARLLIDIRKNTSVSKGVRIAEWDPYTIPIITEKSGKIKFRNIITGLTVKTVTDEITGMTIDTIIGSSQGGGKKGELRPCIVLLDENDNTILLPNGSEMQYYLPVGVIINVKDGDIVRAGDILARVQRESSKTRDITGGLPRVVEILEARKPKDHAIVADIDGEIKLGKDYKTKKVIAIHSVDSDAVVEYSVSKDRYVMFNDGEFVKRGETIVDGAPLLQDILRVNGPRALMSYIVREVQAVYRLQGVRIDDKHIEIIVKQMLQYVEITDSGDTTLLVGDKIHRKTLEEVNSKLPSGARQASFQPTVEGITRASFYNTSFIASASFQEAVRVLTDAATTSSVDPLVGMKENMMIGRIIPAGTGSKNWC